MPIEIKNYAGAVLRTVDADALRGADLYGANLRGANLRGADLCRADLSGADLRWADLSGANLYGANLYGANLRGADLCRADLCRADLSGADLSGADLRGANLRGADLPSPPMMLLASWGEVSPALCRDLMRYDAANHPDGTRAFTKWAKQDGDCPYADLKIQRAASFTECREHWKPGPAQSAYKLMVRLIREKCKDSDYHKEKKGKGK